jgi:hypothetical protein
MRCPKPTPDPVAAVLAEPEAGKLADVDAGLQAVLDCMEPARIQLQEAVYALNNYVDKVELDPERLRPVDARMDAIHGTARKFRVTPEELPEEHASLKAKLRSWPTPATWTACAPGRKSQGRLPGRRRASCRAARRRGPRLSSRCRRRCRNCR